MRGIRSFWFALVAVLSVATILTAPASAQEAPVDPADPTAEVAPVASFDLTTTTPENRTYYVSFDAPVDATDAVNLANYTLIRPGSTGSLEGIATVSYDAVERRSTVIVDAAATIYDERVTLGVQDIKSATGEAMIVPVTDRLVVQQAPSRPGVPTQSSPANNRSLVWAWTAATDEGEYSSGVAGYNFELLRDGGVVQSGQTTELTVTTAVAEDGNYTLRVWATDNSGMMGEWSESAPNVVDTVAPTVVIRTPLIEGSTYIPVVTTSDEALVYRWTTDAPRGALQISNTAVAQPTFTFLADGTYVLTLTVTDAYGNSTVVSVTVIYVAPFIPGRGNELPPVEAEPLEFVDRLIEPRTVRVAPATTFAAAVAPQIASAAVVATDQPSTDIIRAEQPAPPVAAIATTEQGWKVLGMHWYWWLLVVAVIVTAWMWGRSVGRTKSEDDL